MQESVLAEHFTEATYDQLRPFGVTPENVAAFFHPAGQIKKHTLATVSLIVDAINATSPFRLRRKTKSEVKAAYLRYIHDALCNKPTPPNQTLPFRILPPKPPTQPDHYASLPPTRTPLPAVPDAQQPLPARFFATQHPQYSAKRVLALRVVPEYQRLHITFNTSNVHQSDRIVVRLFDLDANADPSDVFLDQLFVNSSLVDLHEYIKPLHGMARKLPTIVRQPVDITLKCYGIENSLVAATNKSASSVALVVVVCEYVERARLAERVLDGTNQRAAELQEQRCTGHAATRDVVTRMVQAHDDDIEEESRRIALWCPLSFVRITLPVRGRQCRHTTVVEGSGLIDYCLGNEYWNCPLCEAECLFHDLYVDRDLLAVVQNAPQGCKFAELAGDRVEYFEEVGVRCEDVEEEDVVVVD